MLLHAGEPNTLERQYSILLSNLCKLSKQNAHIKTKTKTYYIHSMSEIPQKIESIVYYVPVRISIFIEGTHSTNVLQQFIYSSYTIHLLANTCLGISTHNEWNEERKKVFALHFGWMLGEIWKFRYIDIKIRTCIEYWVHKKGRKRKDTIFYRAKTNRICIYSISRSTAPEKTIALKQ